MLRGEFRWANGLVIPNNVTTAGAQALLGLALRDEAVNLWVGLCEAVYTPDLQLQDIDEPTLGVGGYVRIQLARNNTDWPTADTLNGTPYLESKAMIWAATGVAFDKPITRTFLAFDDTDVTGDLFALSAALPAELTITPATIESDRTFKYRLYLR